MLACLIRLPAFAPEPSRSGCSATWERKTLSPFLYFVSDKHNCKTSRFVLVIASITIMIKSYVMRGSNCDLNRYQGHVYHRLAGVGHRLEQEQLLHLPQLGGLLARSLTLPHVHLLF